MTTDAITKRSVDAAGPGFLWDRNLRGFGLRVTGTGARSYIFQYRMGGRGSPARRYTIGAHGSPWTPASAREEAVRLSILVKQGTDPRESKRERQREAVDLAFRTYAEQFLERYIRNEWPASVGYAEGILRRHVTPVLGHKPLPAVTRRDITAVLDRIPLRSTALRRNVYSVVRRLFRWAVGRGDLERSPLEGFDAPATVPSRERVLEDDELVIIWRATTLLGNPFGPWFRLLILTGQRREEVAGLDWAELNRKDRMWALPGSRTKNRRAHIIFLSDMAVAILDELAGGEDWPTSGFVFTTTGSTPVSGYSRAKQRLDASVEELRSAGGEAGSSAWKAWRVHDLRRTMATGLQRLGVRFEVIEAVLNHLSGARAGVAGVYQRHDWQVEKREALALWARHVALTVEGRSSAANLVSLRRTAA